MAANRCEGLLNVSSLLSNVSNCTDGETDHTNDNDGLLLNVLAFISIFLILMCLLGNLLIIFTFVKYRYVRTPHNYFLLNLAVSDMLNGITFSIWVYQGYILRTEILSPWSCKFFILVSHVVYFVSACSVGLIAHDRYRITVVTMTDVDDHLRVKQAIKKCLLLWVTALLIFSPLILFYDIVRGYSTLEENVCDVEMPFNFVFYLIYVAFEMGFPVCVTIYYYIRLYLNVRKRARILRQSMGQNATVNPLAVQTCNQDKKILKSATILVGALFIFLSPLYIYESITVLRSIFLGYTLVWSWSFLNSCLNPILYALAYPQFKKAFKTLLRCYKINQVHSIP